MHDNPFIINIKRNNGDLAHKYSITVGMRGWDKSHKEYILLSDTAFPYLIKDLPQTYYPTFPLANEAQVKVQMMIEEWRIKKKKVAK